MEPEVTTLTFEVPPEGIGRLDAWLASCCEGFSRTRIKGLMESGRVTVNGGAVLRASFVAAPGDRVAISVPPPLPAIPQAENIPLDILYEDEHVIIINKPPGLVVHPAPGHPFGTLVNALLNHCPNLSGVGGVARPGIVHRLDMDTSGVMVVAKNDQALHTLAKEFASHVNVRKTYLALVHGAPTPMQGRIENMIGRCPWDRKKMAVVDNGGKPAVTNYRVLTSGRLALVECVIETGRTHQIRVHLASMGHPIAGDSLYGRPGWDAQLSPMPTRQMLHALRLELRHPVTREPLSIEAPLPPDMQMFATGLKRGEQA